MVKESIHGEMVGDMMENIRMIRNKDMEYINGLMDVVMKVNGLMGDRMVMVDMLNQMVRQE